MHVYVLHVEFMNYMPSPFQRSHPAKVPAGGTDQVSGVAPAELDDENQSVPCVMQPANMSRNEKEKVRRACTPKPTTGRLEVPQDIFEMWNDSKGKGRARLFSLWCKSGGVKAG